ncbi:MAG: EAL domain-containing protein [Burkholderiaceae bacterium]|nr:EAL domain-containing protein [Burkholderiaceae bacterium]
MPFAAITGIRLRLFPDYAPGAVLYWMTLTATGLAAAAYAILQVASLPREHAWQVLGIALVAAIVAMFPLRIPKTKYCFAAGDIFIFLLLMLYGPQAAVFAAAAESAAIAWRSSKRWSSRLFSPAAAAVAMLVCASAYQWMVETMRGTGIGGDGGVFVATMLFAACYFVVGSTLAATLLQLKRKQWPNLVENIHNGGWIGLSYAASASVAAVLYLAFRQFGATTLIVAVPMVAMFQATLHYYFAQQEATEREALERSSRERAEASQREAAQQAHYLRELERSEKRFQSAFTHSAIGMGLVAADGRLLRSNHALCALLQRPAERIYGVPFGDLLVAEDAATLHAQLERVLAREVDSVELELRCRPQEGADIWMLLHCALFADAGESEACLIFQAQDITARRLAESQLRYIAYHDSLTHLANRSRFYERLTAAIDMHRREPTRHFAVMYLDFDRFKRINDSMGHGAGDKFLVRAARRIKQIVRPTDVVARLGGDEFAILTELGGGTHQAVVLAERLQDALHKPFWIAGTEISTSASIGITFSNPGYESPEEVMRDADLAMYKAKNKGRACYALFDASLYELASERMKLESELQQAMGSGQLAFAFQPLYRIEPRRLVGFEALMRWEHPQRGLIGPGSFIPVAEESALIGQLTQWAIRRVCRQLRAWHDAFPASRELVVHVNISGKDLSAPHFAEHVREALREAGVPPASLTLEITESKLMEKLESVSGTLRELRELGVGLSVDDFGTGYSSLSYLSALPITSLKIDRSFVRQIGDTKESGEIVRAIVRLADALGKDVIAEGVENKMQLDRLRELDCACAQGFFLSRPLAPANAAELLEGLSQRSERMALATV